VTPGPVGGDKACQRFRVLGIGEQGAMVTGCAVEFEPTAVGRPVTGAVIDNPDGR